MQIVIDFPDIKYQWIKENPLTYDDEYCEAIRNGTPLPKGHGRLIDANVVDDNIYDLARSMDLNYGQISEVLDNAPTIIEAERSEEKLMLLKNKIAGIVEKEVVEWRESMRS